MKNKNYNLRLELKQYNKNLLKIESLKLQLKEITNLSSISYDKQKISFKSNDSPVERLVIKKAEIENQIDKLQYKKNRLDIALKSLNDEELEIVKAHYINNQSWNKLQERFYLSENTLRHKGKKCLDLMVEVLG